MHCKAALKEVAKKPAIRGGGLRRRLPARLPISLKLRESVCQEFLIPAMGFACLKGNHGYLVFAAYLIPSASLEERKRAPPSVCSNRSYNGARTS